eukprot:m.251238 g.251238  ORF g.251238 m.251238 type:complete len:338 (+) comp26501_c1_seq1:289-1302(+)
MASATTAPKVRFSRVELNKQEVTRKADAMLTDYDKIREPHIPPEGADDFLVQLPFNDLLPELKCPICLSIIQQAAATQECLHRFCNPCITKSLTTKKECPTCRVKVKTQRSLRKDPAFDALVSIIYPDKDAFERRQEEVLRKVRANSNQGAMIQSFKDGIKNQDHARKQKHLSTPRAKGWEEARRLERARATSLLNPGRQAKRARTDPPPAVVAPVVAPPSAPLVQILLVPHPDDGESAVVLARKFLEVEKECTFGHIKAFLSKTLPGEDRGPSKADAALYNLSVKAGGQGFVQQNELSRQVAATFKSLPREEKQQQCVVYYSSAAVRFGSDRPPSL